MRNETMVVEAYQFASVKEYEKARKEQEVIAYIKAKNELNDLRAVIKLYKALVEKNTFHTVVGYAFLEELRQQILTGSDISEEQLPYINIVEKEEIRNKSQEDYLHGKYKKLYEDSKAKFTKSMIVNIFLGIAIAIMLLISLASPQYNDHAYENEILDKYSSWKEELQQKELELEQRENALEKEVNK